MVWFKKIGFGKGEWKAHRFTIAFITNANGGKEAPDVFKNIDNSLLPVQTVDDQDRILKIDKL